MITLKHLTIENFRLLREINLHFPQRGSILIQGPNEAGKSTLLESIYFALYGAPLPAAGRRRTLDDLISYGAPHAAVTLTLSIGVTELTIERSIQRHEGQSVALQVHKLGMPGEAPITDVTTANERIIMELGRLDGETLRNSCFVEQKELNRLEILPGSEREATLRKLLGLEKLTRLAEVFKVTEQDEQLLKESKERLRLAKMQARIPELSARLGEIEAALDAVAIADDLEEIRQQETEIAEQDLSLEQIKTKRQELKNKQGRIQQLKKADAILADIIAAYDAMAEAQRELPLLDQQIAELERREREELPALEKRVYDLEDLSQSFSTLERLATDLFAVGRMVDQLEREQREQHPLAIDGLETLEEQISRSQSQIEQIQQTQHELDELQNVERPRLLARLPRLKSLAERLVAFRQMHEQYAQRIMQEGLAEEQSAQLVKIQRELHETEQELVLVEAEAQQTQQRADSLEKRWRQLSIRRQLEEWQRLKGLSQGLVEAEQHVRIAHQQQEQLTLEAMDARRATSIRMGILIACIVITVASGALAGFEAFLNQSYVIATVFGMVALLAVAGVGWSIQNYSKARENEQVADQRMQQAISQVSMMVAAREAAGRMGGRQDALMQVEHEIRSLGGTIPQTIDEARVLLERLPDQGESLADIQQQMTKTRTDVLAARNQVNVTIEAVAALRKEQARLENQLRNRDWQEKTIAQPVVDKADLEHIYQDISALAAQERLPIPGFEQLLVTKQAPTTQESEEGLPALETLVGASIQDTERALVSIDAKLEVLPDITQQIKVCQEALDALLERRRIIMERHERFQTYNPVQQLERAREQQATLSEALRSLQDSLRQRVHPMGIPFGQTNVHNAETTTRKQLELLHIALGTRPDLQQRRANYLASLKEHQESLSEYYRQLAKFSSSLGSWVVPLNPFAEALSGLRTRCQQEVKEADEESIVRDLDTLRDQEGASRAKIALCYQDIEQAQERIATMLAQHNRPSTRGYALADIVSVWPIVGEYSSKDRSRLQDEHRTIEEELHELEQQELELSTELQLSDTKLDLEQAQIRMELQERNYETKKRGGLMVKALNERMMHKMLPRTEYYMQQLVPLLTCGRYRDVSLATEASDDSAGSITGGPFSLRVWETAAGEYLPKSALSGGTADQLSLALRLAFVIAALPRELVLAPGFVFLDEPLSSLDRAHTQALVDIVTGEILGQHFEQILLVSHSSAFDPALFPYHVYMDGGLVVESNLPAPALEVSSNGASPSALPVPAPVVAE